MLLNNHRNRCTRSDGQGTIFGSHQVVAHFSCNACRHCLAIHRGNHIRLRAGISNRTTAGHRYRERMAVARLKGGCSESGLCQGFAVIHLSRVSGREGHLLAVNGQRTIGGGHQVVAHFGRGGGNVNTVHRGNHIRLRTGIGNRTFAGHGHRKGMGVAALKSSRGEAALRQCGAVVRLGGVSGRESHFLTVDGQATINSGHQIVADCGRGGSNVNTVHRGNHIRLRASIGNRTFAGHGHRKGMRVAAFKSSRGEASLGQCGSIVHLSGVGRREGHRFGRYFQSSVHEGNVVAGCIIRFIAQNDELSDG